MAFSSQLKEIIADFHEKILPQITHRSIDYEIVPHKIITVTGVRRAGKTCFLYQIMHTLVQKGVPKQSILYLNFEDDRLSEITVKELSKILDCYFELYPENKKKKVYLFLDEIQNIGEWEKFVRRLHDSEEAQIFVSGSSAKLLSREIATSLRGRCINYEIFPFSFGEFLIHLNNQRYELQGKLWTHDTRQAAGNQLNQRHRRGEGEAPAALPREACPPPAEGDPPKAGTARAPIIEIKETSSSRAEIKHAFNDYIKYGGYPEIIGYSERIWRKTLQDYINLILYKDLIERHDIKNHSLVKYFIRHLLQNLSSPFSVNKFFKDMKSQGFSVGKDTLHLYLSYIEDAYAFFTVPIFSNSLRVQQVNYRKLYCVDVGLSQASVLGLAEREGALLENLVYVELRRDDVNEIYYYKTRSSREIDFFVIRNKKERDLIQVSVDPGDRTTRKREIGGLCEAMEELSLSKSMIITRDTEERFSEKGKEIKLIPFWKWAIRHQRTTP
ncbi:MAG: ATP-binding protein [Deltaproteobacteria bacterium]|nr:ATP-binding protein [Deltaproteobacteria bacterium]